MILLTVLFSDLLYGLCSLAEAFAVSALTLSTGCLGALTALVTLTGLRSFGGFAVYVAVFEEGHVLLGRKYGLNLLEIFATAVLGSFTGLLTVAFAVLACLLSACGAQGVDGLLLFG